MTYKVHIILLILISRLIVYVQPETMDSDHIRTIIKARGINYPNITGKTFAVFRVDSRHHLVSLVSRIDPSPDWIVGVSNLELCLKNCSWIENKVLNLYPWDAGTDDGATYTAIDQPLYPRQPIKRIKSNSPNDPRSPFYDLNGADIKPLARLILSRQRLYEKRCETLVNENDDFDPQTDNKLCEVEEWSEWSHCSVTCGRGIKYKQRGYKNDDSKLSCNRVLTKRAPCWAAQRHCRKHPKAERLIDTCTVTEWGNWSSCSRSCGVGVKTRSRRFRTRNTGKHCAMLTESPPKLEETMQCNNNECNQKDSYKKHSTCDNMPWSLWTPCSATCGKGFKMRHKLFQKNYNFNKFHHKNGFTEETSLKRKSRTHTLENICASEQERVECENDDYPDCSMVHK